MKILPIVGTFLFVATVAAGPGVLAETPMRLWAMHCQKCHAKDGSGCTYSSDFPVGGDRLDCSSHEKLVSMIEKPIVNKNQTEHKSDRLITIDQSLF
jgi:hypothetical protein